MKHYESTDDLIKMLKSGEYKQTVIGYDEDEEFYPTEEFFDSVLEDFKQSLSDPSHFDYLYRRKYT